MQGSVFPLLEYLPVGKAEESARALGSRVRDRRLALGISQEEVARRAGRDTDGGIGHAHVSKVERGATDPSARVIRLLARGLGMDPTETFELLDIVGKATEEDRYRAGRMSFEEFVRQDNRLDEDAKNLMVYLYRRITNPGSTGRRR